MELSTEQMAETAVRRAGGRVTRPRVRVLALLLREGTGLTHRQIENRLETSRGINRVTIYRVLEWLVQHGLAHKIATGARAWRFDAIDPGRVHQHAHFQCNQCGIVTCLDELTGPRKVKLPEGFSTNGIELTVKGVCARCGAARGNRAATDQEMRVR